MAKAVVGGQLLGPCFSLYVLDGMPVYFNVLVDVWCCKMLDGLVDSIAVRDAGGAQVRVHNYEGLNRNHNRFGERDVTVSLLPEYCQSHSRLQRARLTEGFQSVIEWAKLFDTCVDRSLSRDTYWQRDVGMAIIDLCVRKWPRDIQLGWPLHLMRKNSFRIIRVVYEWDLRPREFRLGAWQVITTNCDWKRQDWRDVNGLGINYFYIPTQEWTRTIHVWKHRIGRSTALWFHLIMCKALFVCRLTWNRSSHEREKASACVWIIWALGVQ